MKKFLKWFLGITAVGAIVGLVIAYFCRDMEYEECEEDEGCDDEDFELDKDLKPARDREYVPLKRSGECACEKPAEKEAEKETVKAEEPAAVEKAEEKAPEEEKKAEEEKKPEEEKAE